MAEKIMCTKYDEYDVTLRHMNRWWYMYLSIEFQKIRGYTELTLPFAP